MEEKKLDVFVVTICLLLLFIGIYRIPNVDIRQYLEICFKTVPMIAFCILLYFFINKYIAFFFLLAIINLIACSLKYSAHINLVNTITYTYLNIFLGILWYFFLVAFLPTTEKKNIYNCICIIVLCHLFFLFLQYLKIDPFHLSRTNPGENAIVGMLTNQNEMSCLIAIGATFFYRKTWWLFTPLLLAGLFICQSLGGIFSYFIGVIFFSILGQNFYFLLFPLVLIFVIFMWGIRCLDPNTLDSIIVRWKLWGTTLKYFYRDKFFGAGLGMFKWVTRSIKEFRQIDCPLGTLWWATTNNEYIQGLFEMGIIFPIILIGYFGNILKRCLLWARPIEELRIELTVLISIAIACSYHYVFHNAVNAIIAITALALLEITLREGEGDYFI